MWLGVTGSRTWTDAAIIFKRLDELRAGHPDMSLVHGGAQGVDTLAGGWAGAKRVEQRIIRPDYAKFGKRAPLIRNDEIVALADVLVAFWDHESRGTAYTINAGLVKDIPVFIVGLSGHMYQATYIE